MMRAMTKDVDSVVVDDGDDGCDDDCEVTCVLMGSKTLNPKPLNPRTLNPRTLNPKPLNP